MKEKRKVLWFHIRKETIDRAIWITTITLGLFDLIYENHDRNGYEKLSYVALQCIHIQKKVKSCVKSKIENFEFFLGPSISSFYNKP